MKKPFSQITILALVLIFIASVTRAYIAPSGTAGVTNTDGPLTTSSIDQTKAGGLAVGTFQAQKSSLFQQNAFFDGSIRGGTPTNNLGVPVKFGGPSNKVDALLTGSMIISGTYQSDTLKTGGGKKPLCADDKGILYICGSK